MLTTAIECARITSVALSPSQIREVLLPTSLRGFDRDVTKTFLRHAALSLEEALDERDSARRDLMRARAEVRTAEAAISSALLAAQRTADQLLVDARAEAAARIRQAEERLTALRLEEAKLREQLGAIRSEGRELLEQATAALDKLETAGEATSRGDGADLHADLRPSGPELPADRASSLATESA
jgi:cell division septum initiation protein DivIVA